MNIIRKLLVVGAALGLVIAAAAWPAAKAITSAAKEVFFLFPHEDPAIVTINRTTYDGSKDPKKVLEIYGTAVDEPLKVVFVPESKLKRPAENPSIAYVELKKDEPRPWQAKTIEFAAKYAVGGGVIGAVVCLLGLLLAKAAAPAKGGRSAAAE